MYKNSVFFDASRVLPQSVRTALLASLLLVGGSTACKLRPQTAGSAEVQRDIAPGFSLVDEQGQQVTLASATANGPVVLVFYRGFW